MPLTADRRRPVLSHAPEALHEFEASALTSTTREKERMALALEAGNMGVWDWDLATGRSVWNDQMFVLTGLDPQRNLPGAEAFMALVHPDDVQGLNHAVAAALAGRTAFSADFRLFRADTGEERWIAGRGRAVCDASGETVAMLGVNFDITAETHKEAKLKGVAKRRAEFLAMLGHELRNPLAPLAYLGRKMETSPLSVAEQAQAAAVLKRQVLQLTRLVDDLLEVSRIELGKIDLQMQSVALEAVIAAAVEAVMPSIQERNQTLSQALVAGLCVRGDAARLTQVVTNLLSNASKYTPCGGALEIAVGQDGPDATIRLSDNGPGIEPDLLPLLFDPFTQGLRTLDRAQEGLGVGLSIVKRLVELHGGKVVVASSGQGATFTVTLPGLPAPHDGEAVQGEGRAASQAPDRPGQAPRVLIVEDNRDAAAMLAEVLREEGYEVLLAEDGQEGLEMARALAPDAILMDIGLPELDGWSVARALRQEARCKDAVMVAMSGYSQPVDRERSREAGFDLHLAKPADLSQLLHFLALNVRPMAAEAAGG